MKTSLAAAFALVLAVTPATAQTVSGSYTAGGTNFDGSRYAGTAEITPTSESTCDIEWVTGGVTSSGICMRNGDSFAAAYSLGDEIGLVIYHVLPDGSLNGLWTIAGKPGVGTEILTPR